MDVEGFEKEVLMGPENTLDVTDKIVIEVRKENREFIEKLVQIHEFRIAKEDETYPNIYNIIYSKKY